MADVITVNQARRLCKQCGEPICEGKAEFCSVACLRIWRRRPRWKNCNLCGTLFWSENGARRCQPCRGLKSVGGPPLQPIRPGDPFADFFDGAAQGAGRGEKPFLRRVAKTEIYGGKKMKLKNLEKLIRKTGYVEVIEGGDELWIGNGYAAAPLFDFRKLNDDQLKALFNISEKEAGKIVISHVGADELLVNDVKDEEQLEPALLGLTLGERAYEVFGSRQGTVFVPTELLQPFLQEDGAARLFVRRREGRTTVAVKKGFFLVGLIEAAQNVITRNLCETLETLYVDTAKQMDEAPPGALLAQL